MWWTSVKAYKLFCTLVQEKKTPEKWRNISYSDGKHCEYSVLKIILSFCLLGIYMAIQTEYCEEFVFSYSVLSVVWGWLYTLEGVSLNMVGFSECDSTWQWNWNIIFCVCVCVGVGSLCSSVVLEQVKSNYISVFKC